MSQCEIRNFQQLLSHIAKFPLETAGGFEPGTLAQEFETLTP